MSYLYVLSPTLALVGFGVFDVAKIPIFPDMARKRNPRRPEGGRVGWYYNTITSYANSWEMTP